MNEDYEQWPEEELIRALKDSDNRAFKQVYRQGYSMVEALVAKNSGSAEDAQDVFQEVLFILVKKLRTPGFQLSSALNTFLYAIARNVWRNRLRRRKPQVEFQDTRHDSIDLTESDVNVKRLFEKRHGVVRQLLDGLSDKCREILVGYYYSKKPLRAIGDEMGLKEGSVKVQKHRCMGYLKNEVEAHPEYQNLINEGS